MSSPRVHIIAQARLAEIDIDLDKEVQYWFWVDERGNLVDIVLDSDYYSIWCSEHDKP